MKNSRIILVFLGAISLALSIQSCDSTVTVSENSTETIDNSKVVIEEPISQEDSIRNLLPEATSNFVNDFEDIFTDEEEEMLLEKVTNHQESTTNEIGIVTTAQFAPYENIDNYSVELFNKWGIGTKENNNGILFTVSKENQRVRISTGMGMENVLTDSAISVINNEIMIPFFIGENYFGGVNAGLDAVIELMTKTETK